MGAQVMSRLLALLLLITVQGRVQAGAKESLERRLLERRLENRGIPKFIMNSYVFFFSFEVVYFKYKSL